MSTGVMNAENKASAKKNERPKMSGKKKLLIILLSFVLMVVFRTGFVFILIALLPSIVTYYIDISRHHYVFKTIFACNLSALMPFIGKMIENGPRSMVMQEIMGDATNWMLIYGSAMMGWLMVQIGPMIAYAMISGFHRTQVMRLNFNQKRIENEWGPEVTQFDKPHSEDDE